MKVPEIDDAQRRRLRERLLDITNDLKPRSRSRTAARHTVVDLFCGCGGLSSGLESTGRFRTLIAIDQSPEAVEMFRRNHGTDVTVLREDLARLDLRVIRQELRRQGILTGELDCLVGGPPCEGFSQNKTDRSAPDSQYDFVARKTHSMRFWTGASQTARALTPERTARAHRADRRNTLFRVMLRVTKLVRPKVVLIENVREILTYRGGKVVREIKTTLEGLGYRVEVKTVNAADYGVPQLRKRAIIVGVRRDIERSTGVRFEFPEPTHIAPPQQSRRPKELRGDLGQYVSAWEAIGDLPLARTANGVRSRPAHVRRSATASAYRAFVRRRGAVSDHEERTISERVLRRVEAMKPGMRTHHLPSRLRTRKFFYNSYTRLEWNRPANTITKSFLYLGSGRFTHPEENRGLTIREAARLQSFPDDFEFVGPSAKIVANLIGGAVPPLLARAIGMSIHRLLHRTAPTKRQRASSTMALYARRARRRTSDAISSQTASVSARTRHSGNRSTA